MTDIQFPLNEVQLSLLKLTNALGPDEIADLKRLILAYKAKRVAFLAQQNWEEKGWSDETMDAFLATHMRIPYKIDRK